MEEKYPIGWTSATNYLKTAALLPQQREELISCALEQLLVAIPAVATALIWPCQNRKAPWKIFCAGDKRNAIHRWLSARLDPSAEVTIGVLQHDLTGNALDMPSPLFMRLQTSSSSSCALWIVWTVQPPEPQLLSIISDWVERVRQTLEAVLEVEDREEQYFSTSSLLNDRELIDALASGDAHALSAFLSLTRVVAKADFTFWARAYQDVVEITSHLGARHGEFGFALARGHGVGGRVAAYGTPIVGDYRNSPYRDSSVSDIVDSEQVRSGIALPIRYNTLPDTSAHVAAVLYATRRTTTRFSLAECLLVQRLARLLEPLPLEIRARSFFLPGVKQLPDHKAEWYDIVLHASRIESVEAWARQFIKGPAIVTDRDGNPYVLANKEQLEQLRVSRSSQPEAVKVLSLTAPGVHLPGQVTATAELVYLYPSISLPPPHWPDFFTDLVAACNLVIARMEQAQDQLDRQREQWLRALLQGKTQQIVEQEGYRLGLPVEHGHLWVLAWPSETMQATKAMHKRLIAASVVLDNLKSPLMFFDDGLAVVLLGGQPAQPPSKVRDALLKHCGVYPLWIVHGGRYHSLQELKMTLTHVISLAHKARREENGEYLLDIYAFGLDSLLENPRFAEELDTFATKLLAPLVEYDAASGSHLTETFVLMQTLDSIQSVADHLGVHVNTIRYRLHRAEGLSWGLIQLLQKSIRPWRLRPSPGDASTHRSRRRWLRGSNRICPIISCADILSMVHRTYYGFEQAFTKERVQPMIHHILVATDGSDNAERAVQFSAQVADRRHQAEVTVVFVHLHVTPAMPLGIGIMTPELPLEQAQALREDQTAEDLSHAQSIVDHAVAEIRRLVTSPDVTVSGRVVVSNHVDEGILEVARETPADIIVIGTRGLSALRGAIMGSVSHSLIEKAACPVLVVK